MKGATEIFQFSHKGTELAHCQHSGEIYTLHRWKDALFDHRVG